MRHKNVVIFRGFLALLLLVGCASSSSAGTLCELRRRTPRSRMEANR